MWDAERRVGVLNDFDLAGLTNQEGASGQGNTGTLPYMALDLLSEKGLRGEIPRLYRHDAESFAWSLIYLCLSTVKNEEGEKYTMLSRRLGRWFADWETCRNAKLGTQWEDYDESHSDIVYAHPNAMALARSLYSHWSARYRKQFPGEDTTEESVPSVIAQKLGRADTTPPEATPYVEEDDDTIFQSLLILHERRFGLGALGELKHTLVNMHAVLDDVDWSD